MQLDLFVKVMLLEETPAILSWWKLCEDLGYTCHWISGQKPHLIRNGKRTDCNISNYVPFVVLGLSASSSTTPTSTSSSSPSQDSVFDVNKCTESPIAKEVEVRVKSFGETRCMNPKKPKTKKKGNAKKYKAIYCMICQIGCRSSERIWSTNVVLLEPRRNLIMDIETLPVLLMNFQWSREQKWNRVRVSIVSTRTFRRTQIAISAWRRK